MIKQAVIFCDRFDKNAENIVSKIPKPMVDVAGKPFLEHLIIQLKNNGIRKIIFLTGCKDNLIMLKNEIKHIYNQKKQYKF